MRSYSFPASYKGEKTLTEFSVNDFDNNTFQRFEQFDKSIVLIALHTDSLRLILLHFDFTPS